MPVDFEVANSYGVGLQCTLDTRAETFSTQMCNNFVAQNTPRWHFQDKRYGTAGNQLKKTTFFTLPRPHFTEECPGFGPCTLIEPEALSTLQVFTNGQTHIKWNFRQNYELNRGAPARQQLLQVQKRRENDRISVIAIQQQQLLA
jgi:hypothetical protein